MNSADLKKENALLKKRVRQLEVVKKNPFRQSTHLANESKNYTPYIESQNFVNHTAPHSTKY